MAGVDALDKTIEYPGFVCEHGAIQQAIPEGAGLVETSPGTELCHEQQCTTRCDCSHRSVHPGVGENTAPFLPVPVLLTGTRVVYRTRDERRVPGTVVGPDQDFFPSPVEVFVSFPSSGLTRLLPISDLELDGRG